MTPKESDTLLESCDKLTGFIKPGTTRDQLSNLQVFITFRFLTLLYIPVTVHPNKFLFYNQPDALIIQIYSVIKIYMFRASSLPIIRSFLLYIRHW